MFARQTGKARLHATVRTVLALPRVVPDGYSHFSWERFFLELDFGVLSVGDAGSSTRASSALSGGSTLSVARVLFHTALPRESCSTLPLRPL